MGESAELVILVRRSTKPDL